MKKHLLILSILILALSGCVPAASAGLQTDTPAPVSSAAPPTQSAQNDLRQATSSPSGATSTAPQVQPSPTPRPTSTRVLSPTPDTRLLPEQWREWPVVPAITNRAVQIYLQGLAQGNNPRHFGKVGDCQCVNASFMGFYDHPGRYAFPKGYESLQETVDYFAGSFDRVSAAVKGGFNVASVLSALQADPQVCRSGETPLQCEFRLHQPAIVFISMETGFEGRTAETYEKYMVRIIDFVIDKGALPILATKADNVEGNHSINLATARLAYKYDIPLWNFWRAVQSLPNKGMDAERADGFHISVEAWNVRSFTALQVLDAAWRAVKDLPAGAGGE